jgi:hypothetical protein
MATLSRVDMAPILDALIQTEGGRSFAKHSASIALSVNGAWLTTGRTIVIVSSVADQHWQSQWHRPTKRLIKKDFS